MDFWGNDLPFLRPASQRPADIWTDGLVELLRGLDAFSVDWCDPPIFGPAIPGALPRTEHELHGVRCWRALQEVARGADAAGDPASLTHIRRVREEETEWTERRLGRLLDRDPTTSEVTLTLVLLDGLRSDLTAPNARLGAEEADDILLTHVQRLREHPG